MKHYFKKLRKELMDLTSIWFNIKLFVASFFWGLKTGDEIISKHASFNNDDEGIHKELKGSGVMADMLEEKQTQEVAETRDTYYRVLKEADKYHVNVIGFHKTEDDSDDVFEISAIATKKPLDEAHVEVMETKGYDIEVIQDKKTYENDMETQMKEGASGQEIKCDEVEIFTIENDFMPRFSIGPQIKKLVVKRKKRGKKRLIDLYFSIYTRQFYKIDSLFIAEMKRIMESEDHKSDIFDFKTIEFVTDKAYGAESLHHFKFKNKGLVNISIYDGHYVVEFEVDTVIDEDLTEKYKTKELTKKYKINAIKHDGIDINTIMRHENSN